MEEDEPSDEAESFEEDEPQEELDELTEDETDPEEQEEEDNEAEKLDESGIEFLNYLYININANQKTEN